MDTDYNLLKTFCKVSELGSFTKAAHVLKQPKSTVSRSISKLEDELGVELIRRTTRKISLTDTGQELYRNISKSLSDIRGELIRISDLQDEMQGTIRMTTSDSFAQYSLVSLLSLFKAKYPLVKLEIIVTNSYVNLIEESIDLAIRAGKLDDSTLVQKKLVATKFIFVCSKKYIEEHGRPKTIKDLASHNFLSFKPLEKSFAKTKIELNTSLSTGSLPMLLKMALNSDGITVLPDFVCHKYLEAKELVRVIPSWQTKSENLHILYPPTKNQAKRVKEFIAFAKDYYSDIHTI